MVDWLHRRKQCPFYLMVLLLIGGATPAASGQPIEIGIVPYLPTQTLLERFRPLRGFLEKRLGEAIIFTTAPDYPTFFQRTARQEYPYLITVGHAARLAERESGYIPLLRPGFDSAALLVVRKDSPYQHIADLRGKKISSPGAYAFVTQLGVHWLRQTGLKPGEDVTLTAASTHTTAMHEVTDGVVDAAFISNRAMVAAKSDMKDALRPLGLSADALPGIVYMASSQQDAKRIAAFKAAVLAFVQTPEGKTFVASLGYDTLRAIEPNELAFVEPYAQELKKLMGTVSAPQ